MPMITVQVDATKVIITIENHGGREVGECIACGAIGWRSGAKYGFPSSKIGQGNKIIHKPKCPMNAVLTDDGSFKK